jgi:hypothetical protein
LVFIVAALFIGAVKADTNETGYISRIIVEGDSTVSVWLDGVDDLSECNGGSRWTVTIIGDQLFKEKVSILLTTATSRQKVHLHGLTGYGCGNWESNKIYYIDVMYD